MKLMKTKTMMVHTALVAALAGGWVAGLGAGSLQADPPASGAITNAVTAASAVTGADTNAAAAPMVVSHHLTGAELYSIHCNRCHPQRYPTERTAANWKTIMLHMQVRANIPVKQSKLILKYLQDNSGR